MSAEDSTDAAALGAGQRARRNVARRLAVLALLLACAWLLHAPVLRGLAGLLVVDQGPSRCTHVLIAGGDGRFDAAAALYREDPSRRLVLVQTRPEPLVRLGILPSPESLCRRELAHRGVPPEAVEVVRGDARNEWQAARSLDAWLAARPEAEVVVLCDRFQSCSRRWALDGALSGENAARVHVRGLPNRRYDETNWWRVRAGVKEVFVGLLALTYTGLGAGQEPQPPEWDPDAFDRALIESTKTSEVSKPPEVAGASDFSVPGGRP